MIFLFIAVVAFFSGYCFGLAKNINESSWLAECPRTIRGYNCRGQGCDHSPKEVMRAKAEMGFYRNDRPKF